jgi:hypothetical protein
MPPRGTPLTPDERRALFAWVLADGAVEVAGDLGCSKDSVANWIAGLNAPFPLQHGILTEKLRSRRKTREAAAR